MVVSRLDVMQAACSLHYVQVVHGAKAWNNPLSGSRGQRSRLHEDEAILEGLAEASFLSFLSRVAFLVLNWSLLCPISIVSSSHFSMWQIIVNTSTIKHLWSIFLSLLQYYSVPDSVDLLNLWLTLSMSCLWFFNF